jgi:hypothetical protein
MAGSHNHIKPIRLFDFSQAKNRHLPFQFNDLEQSHFDKCRQCQNVLAAFTRMFREIKPPQNKPEDAA